MNPMSAMQGLFDVKAPDASGVFVASSWQIPTNVASVARMGQSAIGKVGRKYAWMWFLIPTVTILAFVISKL